MRDNLAGLQYQLEEFAAPGQRVAVLLGLPRDISNDEAWTLESALRDHGLRLTAPVQVGTGPWENTIRLEFERPTRNPNEVGVLPLAVMIIAALGAIGIAGILGYQISQVFVSVARNIIPLALIAGGVLVALAIAKRPPASARARRRR